MVFQRLWRVFPALARRLESRRTGLSARFFPSRAAPTHGSGPATMSPLTEKDVDLARSARRGDPAAVERLAQRLACVPGLVRAMHARLGRPLKDDGLDEFVQDTLAALWTKLGRFDGRSAIETWAYGFAATQLIQFLERKRRRAKLSYGLLAEQSAEADLSRLEFEWVHTA